MISTKSWSSRVVANSFFSLVGMVVFFGMTCDMRPSLMRTPSECGRDVEQHHVLDLAADDRALRRGADRDDLVGVHVLRA